MSAFVVSQDHIRFLVNAGLSRTIAPHGLTWNGGWLKRYEPDTDERAALVGAMLWEENYKSVNYRYRESDAAPRYVHRDEPARSYNPIHVLKAIACLEYQSCEHPEWEASGARAFCEALRMAAIRALPGYSDAPWVVQ